MVFVAASVILILSAMNAEHHIDTRKTLISERRLIRSDGITTLAFKNRHFKEAALAARSKGDASMASVAYQMNLMEERYKIPYSWGGSIKNHLEGLDCTGFIHGLLYYAGYPRYQRRFNTQAVYYQFLSDPDWETVYDSKSMADRVFSATELEQGDIIVWPSSVDDGRNIPGPIWGHIGIVSLKTDSETLVTHYVESDAYNDLDIVGLVGSGLNTMHAQKFIDLKKRGVLAVFRERGF
ncbi:hypothetical protein HRO20_000310 [Vibrio cholerae]|nr:hypothetical protein [Vibrio cholerae]EII3003389.1 hypothetical protein [Vibrio cholerae]EJL6688786.1 hypothetical protein [Vibrio cholerae]EJX1707507.1 hypothetical protein [Vibrio cholerae]HDZ9233645.1 hypothetical protein [Vibrio cholerae]